MVERPAGQLDTMTASCHELLMDSVHLPSFRSAGMLRSRLAALIFRLVAPMLLLLPCCSEPTECEKAWSEGMRLYKEMLYPQAIESFDRFLELGCDEPSRQVVLSRKGLTLRKMGDLVAAEKLQGEALILSWLRGDMVTFANAIMRLGEIEEALGHYGKAIHLYEAARAMFHRFGLAEREITAIQYLQRVYYQIGGMKMILKLGEECARLEDQIPPRKLINCLIITGLAQMRMRDLSNALDSFSHAGVMAQREGDTVSLMIASGNAGKALGLMGETDLAIFVGRMAAEAAAWCGEPYHRGTAVLMVGVIYLRLGDYAAAERLLYQAYQILKETNRTAWKLWSKSYQGFAILRQGRIEKGARIIEECYGEIKTLSKMPEEGVDG